MASCKTLNKQFAAEVKEEYDDMISVLGLDALSQITKQKNSVQTNANCTLKT